VVLVVKGVVVVDKDSPQAKTLKVSVKNKIINIIFFSIIITPFVANLIIPFFITIITFLSEKKDLQFCKSLLLLF